MSPCLNKLTDEQNAWSFYGWESVKRQRQFISRTNLMQLARGDFNLAYKTEELDHLQSLFLIGFQLLFDFKKLKNREIISKCQTN